MPDIPTACPRCGYNATPTYQFLHLDQTVEQLTDKILPALRMVERCQYAWDDESGAYGLWDPETELFVGNVGDYVLDPASLRARLIAEAVLA